MAIRFNCPSCKKPLSVSDDKAGKSTRCPGCKSPLRIPNPEDEHEEEEETEEEEEEQEEEQEEEEVEEEPVRKKGKKKEVAVAGKDGGGPLNYYLGPLKKYAQFSGRASRQEFWMFILFNMLVVFVLYILDFGLIFATGGKIPVPIFVTLYYLATFIPILALDVRRLHDTGRSGLALLFAFIPCAGPFILLFFFIGESERKTNQYGPNPWGQSGRGRDDDDDYDDRPRSRRSRDDDDDDDRPRRSSRRRDDDDEDDEDDRPRRRR